MESRTNAAALAECIAPLSEEERREARRAGARVAAAGRVRVRAVAVSARPGEVA